MSEVVFTNGMIFKLPHENAPGFVKGSLSIKPVEFIQWMRENIKKDSEWINISLKVGKSGKAYASLDTWEPNQGQQSHNNAPQGQQSSSQGNNQGYQNNANSGRGQNPNDPFEDDVPF